MRLKDKIAVNKTIKTCIFYPKYPVGIFINNVKNAELMFYKILDNIPDSEIRKIFNCFQSSPNDGQIVLKNDSVIDIYSGTGYSCLPRYATIIYDNDLYKEYVNNVVLKTSISVQRGYKILHSIHKIKFNK